MNDLISFNFEKVTLFSIFEPLASSGPPGVPALFSKTGNVLYSRINLEMSQSLTVKIEPNLFSGEKRCACMEVIM